MVAGNLALTQWRELFRAGMLDCQRNLKDTIAEKEAELAALKAQVA